METISGEDYQIVIYIIWVIIILFFSGITGMWFWDYCKRKKPFKKFQPTVKYCIGLLLILFVIALISRNK